MDIALNVKRIIKENGRTQKWVADEMNHINPNLKMSSVKLSAIICGIRKMSADELLAFCKATKTNPDIFLTESA